MISDTVVRTTGITLHYNVGDLLLSVPVAHVFGSRSRENRVVS